MRKMMMLSMLLLAGCAGAKDALHGAVGNVDGTTEHVLTAYNALAALIPDIVHGVLFILKIALPLLGL